MSSTGNARLVPAQVGLSPEQVRALTGSPFAEVAMYHEATAVALREARAFAGMAKANELTRKAETHDRWAKMLREVSAAQQQRISAPRLRSAKGVRA